MSKVTLNDLVNLQNETTAVNTVNGNNATLETAFDNTLSRDGTSPNTMGSDFDMNGHRILNLPQATTNSEPITLSQFNGIVTAAGNVPAGGSSAQVLTKNSNTNYDMSWATVGASTAAYTLKGNATGSPATATDISIPGLTQKTVPTGSDIVLVVDAAASNALKYATLSTLPSATGVSNIAGNTGAFTLSTGITNSANDIRLARGQLPGETSNGSASAGNIGEYVSSTVLAGSAVALTTAVAKDVTSISLTAGDWDLTGSVFTTAITGTLQQIEAWMSSTTATQPTRPNAGMDILWNGSTTSNMGVSAGAGRISLSGTTTIYLSTLMTFTGNASAYGFIGARRAR